MTPIPNIGYSAFARQFSVEGTGNSYTSLTPTDVITLVRENWHKRKPGNGEENLDRKVLVPLKKVAGFFCPPSMPLQEGMPVQAKVVARQPGEDPYVELYLPIHVARFFGYYPTSAKTVEVVCYSADALLENGGERSTDCEWEVVTILCSDKNEQEPMPPLTMARNYLKKPGGTFTDYTARDFAEAIYHHSTKKRIKVLGE